MKLWQVMLVTLASVALIDYAFAFDMPVLRRAALTTAIILLAILVRENKL